MGKCFYGGYAIVLLAGNINYFCLNVTARRVETDARMALPKDRDIRPESSRQRQIRFLPENLLLPYLSQEKALQHGRTVRVNRAYNLTIPAG